MRSFVYPFSDDELRDFSVICRATIKDLDRVLDGLRKLEIKTGTNHELRSAVRTIVNRQLADELSSFLRGMRQNMDQHDFSVEEVINAVSRGIKDANGGESVLVEWEKRTHLIERMLDTEAVQLSVKLASLMRQQNNHLHSISITSELLPLFSSDRSEIKGIILKNILSLIIADKNENEELLSIPLGPEDLDRLSKQIDNAKTKMKAIEIEFNASGRPLILYRAHP